MFTRSDERVFDFRTLPGALRHMPVRRRARTLCSRGAASMERRLLLLYGGRLTVRRMDSELSYVATIWVLTQDH